MRISDWSSDVCSSDLPSTQVGAVLVDADNHIIATGYNGFPPGIEETPARWQRPDKYERVIHAEMNAIAHAARAGHSTAGATLYCTHFPCNQVAGADRKSDV